MIKKTLINMTGSDIPQSETITGILSQVNTLDGKRLLGRK